MKQSDYDQEIQDHPLYRLMRKNEINESYIKHIKDECHIKARSCSPKSSRSLLFYEKKMANLLYSLYLEGFIEFSHSCIRIVAPREDDC